MSRMVLCLALLGTCKKGSYGGSDHIGDTNHGGKYSHHHQIDHDLTQILIRIEVLETLSELRAANDRE